MQQQIVVSDIQVVQHQHPQAVVAAVVIQDLDLDQVAVVMVVEDQEVVVHAVAAATVEDQEVAAEWVEVMEVAVQAVTAVAEWAAMVEVQDVSEDQSDHDITIDHNQCTGHNIINKTYAEL